MNSFVQVINNKLICIKDNHNEQVEMVVMDEWVPLSDKFLCLKCFRSKRQITKNIIGVEEAQKLVEEKIYEMNKSQEQSKSNYTEQLIIFIDILMDDFGLRICFINENQVTWQQYSKGIMHIFDIQNGQLIKRIDLNVQLNQTSNTDCSGFPTIYNIQRNIIIQKYDKWVYILKQQDNGKLMIQLQPIECKHDNNFGSLTNDGNYFVIWDYGTKEFKVYNIEYE